MADMQQEQTQKQEEEQQRIIALYETMAAITAKMLAAARAEEWDLLVTLEAECAAQVATLQRDEPALTLTLALPKQQIKQKATLIMQMLADDADIRRLITARMMRLSDQVNSANTERKLSRAYGT